MLISTDPASNLQDAYNTELNNKGVPNLTVANFDPEKAAKDYDHIIFHTAPTGHTLSLKVLNKVIFSELSISIENTSRKNIFFSLDKCIEMHI